LEIDKYETYMTAQKCQVDTILIAPPSPEAKPEIGMTSALIRRKHISRLGLCGAA
jgi:hypothetical protein